ncbi:MAG: type II toxin-antitoxin system VapC family toxin [Halobacteriota archaeon]
MVCLETDFLIAVMRKDEKAMQKLKEMVDRGENLATTPINASELFKGVYLFENINENLKKVRGILGRMDLLSFNLVACDIYGRTYSQLRTTGEPTGEFDTLIASIALSHNERVVTRNTQHFSRVEGLEIEEW